MGRVKLAVVETMRGEFARDEGDAASTFPSAIRRHSPIEHSALAAIIDSSDDAIIGETIEGEIATWNAGAQRIFGYTAEEMVGRSVDVLAPLDRREEEQQLREGLLHGHRVDHFQTIRLTKQGRQIHVSLTISPVRDLAGRVVAASMIARDITEQKNAEELLHLQKTELAHMARLDAMGQMALGLAHELNQPLGAILNFSAGGIEMIKRGEHGPQVIAAYQAIAEQARRAADIIRRLRSFVRKQPSVRAFVDLHILIGEAIHLLEVDLRHAGITVQTRLAAENPHVFVDSVQIVQVLVNLMSNARDAMTAEGAVGRELTIETLCSGDVVETSIIDQGCGMQEDRSEKLFDPFFTTKSTGLGMGLPIVRSIISEMLGQISGTPNPSGGMTFRFTLPRTGETE